MSAKTTNTFGSRLRRLRHERGLSVRQLAEQIGVAFQTYHRWETDRFAPNLKHLEPLAKSLGVSIEVLL